jgi:hypothetical protein
MHQLDDAALRTRVIRSAAVVATKRNGFENGLRLNADTDSERQFPTWNIWNSTIVVKATLCALVSEPVWSRSHRKSVSVPRP